METGIVKYVSDGFERAKNGEAISVYGQVLAYFEAGQLPLKSHYAFGWIIYYALHQTADAEIEGRKRMLVNYLKLNVPKPHKLHSMILTEAMRLYKDAKSAAYGKKSQEATRFSLMRFAQMWELDNLRPGDWRRKEYEGKKLSSTAEKLITSYVDEMEATKINASENFISVIDEALATYPESYSLMSQRASVHAMDGEMDKARGLLRRALLYAPGKFFLWNRLAMLVQVEEDPRRHVALLYKALSCPGPEQMKGKILTSLAAALVKKEQYGYALWELNRVRRIYEANGWHLPKDYVAAIGRIPEGTAAADPVALYKKLEIYADNEVYEALPAIRVTKTFHKNPDSNQSWDRRNYGKPAVAWCVTDSEGKNYWLQPHRFNLPSDLPLGTALEIRVHNSRPVKAWLP